jgi:pimeloyl-ACP methyl ester carboxylesterase
MSLAFRVVLFVFSVVAPILLGQQVTHFFLPAPTGPFPVGRSIFYWTDQSRRENVSPQANLSREVAAFVYYPAEGTGEYAEYYPGLTGLGSILETRMVERQFASAWPSVSAGSVRSRAHADAPFLNGRQRFPVLVFSPGASTPLPGYSIQLEELASHGYVGIGLEHAYDTALIIKPDQRLIPFKSRRPTEAGPPTDAGLRARLEDVLRWVADMRFALDQIESLSEQQGSRFFGRLDLSQMGVFGHSLGGKAAARLCQTDPRVQACLNQDGEMFGIPFGGTEPIASVIPSQSTKAPLTVLYVAEPGFSDAQLASVDVTRIQFEDWRKLKLKALRAFLRSNAAASHLFTIKRPGFVHGSFMDTRQLGATLSGADASQARSNTQIGTTLTLAFFDAILKRKDDKWESQLANPPDGVTLDSFTGQ